MAAYGSIDIWANKLAPKPKPAPVLNPNPPVIPYVSQGAGISPQQQQGFASKEALDAMHAAQGAGLYPGHTWTDTPALPTDQYGQPRAAPPAPRFDPTLDVFRGQKTADIARRKAERDKLVRDRLLGFGSREMARRFFGDNDPFVQMISDDPAASTSWLAEAKRRMNQTLQNTSETLGHHHGLWSSSGRNTALSDIGRDYTRDVAQETRAVEGDITSWDQMLAQATADWERRMFEEQQRSFREGYANSGF